MDIEDIISKILNKNKEEREKGLDQLRSLPFEQEKTVINAVFEDYIHYDRLFEDKEECLRAAEWIQRVRHFLSFNTYTNYVKRMYDMSLNIPNSKAAIIRKACHEFLYE